MQAQPSTIEMLFPFVLIFVIFYFLIIRPQSKRMKTHDQFLVNLKRGDEVVTSGGILGRVDGITDQFVSLEISEGTKIKILRKQIAASQTAALAEPKKK